MSRNIARWDKPFELDLLHDNIDSLFNKSFPGIFNDDASMPITDVYVDDGKLHVESHLPHFDIKDVHVAQQGSNLVITAEHTDKTKDKRKYVRQETSWRYERVLPLPVGSTLEQAEATFGDGVLTVTLPLPETAAPGELKVRPAKKLVQPEVSKQKGTS